MAKGLKVSADGGVLDVALSPSMLVGGATIAGTAFLQQHAYRQFRTVFGENPTPGSPHDLARLAGNAGVFLVGSYGAASLAPPLLVAAATGMAFIGLAHMIDRGWGVITGRRLIV